MNCNEYLFSLLWFGIDSNTYCEYSFPYGHTNNCKFGQTNSIFVQNGLVTPDCSSFHLNLYL